VAGSFRGGLPEFFRVNCWGKAVALPGWLGIDERVKRRPVAKKKVVRPVVYKPSEEGLLISNGKAAPNSLSGPGEG
jgi:hypothetical protein